MANIVLEAARLAALYHKDQKRDINGRPYKTHLDRVAGRVMERDGCTDAMAAGAFLHDSIEDQGTSPGTHSAIVDDILKHCGQDTLEIVVALTNPSKGSKAPRAERKQMDRQHMKMCPSYVRVIKLIDRIDNLNETLLDMQCGYDTRTDFNLLYADESELMLDEALYGTDPGLEKELRDVIEKVRAACGSPAEKV